MKNLPTFDEFVNEQYNLDEGTTPQFKKLIKRAKELGIETSDELQDLIASEFDDENAIITGADYEIARKHLKLENVTEGLKPGFGKTIEKYVLDNFDFPKDSGQTLIVKKNGLDLEVTSKYKAAPGEFEDMADEMVKKLDNEFGIKFKINTTGQTGFRMTGSANESLDEAKQLDQLLKNALIATANYGFDGSINDILHDAEEDEIKINYDELIKVIKKNPTLFNHDDKKDILGLTDKGEVEAKKLKKAAK